MDTASDDLIDPLLDASADGEELADGGGICLSGGGYRAMLYHLGVLRRLGELGVLQQVREVSAVSGGSLTAAVLATEWDYLSSANDWVAAFDDRVIHRVRALADHTIDRPSIIAGTLSPLTTIGEQVDGELRHRLLGETKLAELPQTPRFVFHATNTATGKLVRFSRSEIADYRIGRIPHPDVRLSSAVTASAAFPPFLSPYQLDTSAMRWEDHQLGQYDDPLPYRQELLLTDGGVYDNLGLEGAWKHCRTVFVSDGGGSLGPDPDPNRDWALHTKRILNVLDHQVRSLRLRQVIASYKTGRRAGAFIGIRTPISKYAGLSDMLPAPAPATAELAGVPTRLKKLDDRLQERLINWGYAIADASVRSFFEPLRSPPPVFPYEGGVS